MLDWQKDLLKAIDFPADLNRIIGRQIRCRFPPAYKGDGEKDLDYTIMGFSFALKRYSDAEDLGSVQLLLEASGSPESLDAGEGLARPFLSYDQAWKWNFHGTVSCKDPDRTQDYIGWEPRPVKVAWV